MHSKNSSQDFINRFPPPPEGKSGWPWTQITGKEFRKSSELYPKISVITPSFNQGEYIEQTIRSVLLQNYPNLEYIVVDGGSTDNTPEILKKYENWIDRIVIEKDSGQSDAVNKGIKMCSGEIFNWINSDDYYEPECFKNIAEEFNSRNIYSVSGAYRFFSEVNGDREKIICMKLRDYIEETIADVPINQISTFFRLKIFKSLGKLDERLEFVMDQDIWKKYLFRYGQDNIKITGKVFANFRYHPLSKTYNNEFKTEYMRIYHSIARKNGMPEIADVLRKIYTKISDKNFEFDFSFNESEVITARKALNYYILLEAKKSITENNTDMFPEIVTAINPAYLSEKSRAVYKILKLKSKLYKYNLDFLLKYVKKPLPKKF